MAANFWYCGAMAKRKKSMVGKKLRRSAAGPDQYARVLTGVVELLEQARRASARAINVFMTATYWEIGRRIVECEQRGEERAEYGERVLYRLADDLSRRFGRGFSKQNLHQMCKFYLMWPQLPIVQTVSGQLGEGVSDRLLLAPARGRDGPVVGRGKKVQTVSGQSEEQTPLATISARFPLPWSHYVALLRVDDPDARGFYQAEAMRGGWSVRQLNRQLNTLFYERTMLSRKKGTVLRKGGKPVAGDVLTPEQELKDSLVLEFLDLKDEYSESDLESALVHQVEEFLLELGGDFAFIGRQRRLRIGNQWFRVDLLLYHRRLRCVVVIDLQLGEFTHADAGQMNLYLNFAQEHWTHGDENPPVGIILCSHKDDAVAKYALTGMSSKVMAAEYRMLLPREKELARMLRSGRAKLERRRGRG